MRPNRWSTCCGSAKPKGKVFDSPERKAALDKTLRAALMRIKTRRSAAITAKRSNACAGSCLAQRSGRKPAISVPAKSGKGAPAAANCRLPQHPRLAAGQCGG